MTKRDNPRHRDLPGIAVVVLAAGLIVVLVVGEVLAFLNPAKILSSEEIATIATVLGAMVGAIAGYVGARGPKPRCPAPTELPSGPPGVPGVVAPPEGASPPQSPTELP